MYMVVSTTPLYHGAGALSIQIFRQDLDVFLGEKVRCTVVNRMAAGKKKSARYYYSIKIRRGPRPPAAAVGLVLFLIDDRYVQMY